MPVTIQDLKDFGQTAGGGDQKSFDGLCATVASADPPKEGQYGQMQRVQLRDATGSWYFSAMDCPTLHQGQVIIATGRVKGNEGRKPYFNLTAVRDTAEQGSTGQPAPSAPPPQQGGGQQPAAAPAGKPDYSVGSVADRVELLVATMDRLSSELHKVLLARYGDPSARATLIEPAVVAQLIQTASGIGQGWEKGQLHWKPGQPLEGPPFMASQGEEETDA